MRSPWLTASAGSARARARLDRPGTAVLLAALAVELVDELVDGTKSAMLPLIRHDLALNYVQVGLLTAIPLIVGSLLELPMGVLSGSGGRRRRFILCGGLVFIAAVLAAGLAHSFAVLVIALTAFFPASGAFVSLTQAALMDAAPERQAQHMARWTLAGSAGAVAGPLLAALAVELVDELVDGTKGAALPLIRHDLGLNYIQVGLLTAVPLIVGSVLEDVGGDTDDIQRELDEAGANADVDKELAALKAQVASAPETPELPAGGGD